MHPKEHVVLAASYRWPVYAPAFTKALEESGVLVSRFTFDDLLTRPFSRLQIRLGFGPDIIRMNLELRKFVTKVKPTICLIWTGLMIMPSTVDFIKKNCWVTSYTNDDPFGPRGRMRSWELFRASIPHYHSHHVYRDINVGEYQKLGAQRVGILRSYYIPWINYPPHRTCKNYQYDEIAFVGHGESNRVEVLSTLVEAGFNVKVYGPPNTWENIKISNNRLQFYAGTLDQSSYRKSIWQSAIMLGFLSRQNRDDYTRRYFEVPACGGFLLAERTSTAKELFTEDHEMIFFSNAEEAVEKCHFFLSNPSSRMQIAEAGRVRCENSGYDIHSRANKWINEIIEFRR